VGRKEKKEEYKLDFSKEKRAFNQEQGKNPSKGKFLNLKALKL